MRLLPLVLTTVVTLVRAIQNSRLRAIRKTWAAEKFEAHNV